MNKQRYAVKKGNAGETAFEWLAKAHSWYMFRTQPSTRTITRNGFPIVIRTGTGGIADYTGYRYVDNVPVYTAVECKCRVGTSMPASVLTVDQRKWMSALPQKCAFVFILWDDGTGEIFQFIESGTYVKGTGTL